MQRRAGALHCIIRTVALCLAFLAGGLPAGRVVAQEVAFSEIRIEGNQRIETATILTYAGIEPGSPVTAGQVNAAYQRILGSGLFEEVGIDTSGNRLTITVREYPTINRINFEGNRRIDDETLLSLITSQPRRVYSPSTAEADTQVIADAYQQSGRLDATVVPKIIPRSQNRVDLVFEVTEGAVIEIERIGFVGNRSFTDRRLRQVLETKQAGIFRALVRSDTFIEDRVQFDVQVLTDFYRSRGFIDFQVLSVTPEFSRERDAFFLTFNLQEGQRFRLGQISVTSEVPGIDPAVYAAVLRLRPGQVYSPSLIEDNLARLERKSLLEGLDFIRADPIVTRNERDLTLDIEFALVRGERIFVERIDIEGNSTTLDRVIRRQFNVVEGDPFNPREIRQSAERIRALGYFANADVEAREGTQPDRVIIDVNVEEQPTGSLSFGVNYSIQDGFGVAVGLSERNFLGRGQLLNFQVGVGVDNADSVLTFTEPALLGRDVAGTIDIFYRATDQFSADYNTLEYGFSPSLSFPISENGRLQTFYRLANERISDVDTGDPDDPDDNGSSIILQEEEGTQLTSALGYVYSYDTRRRGINPDAGVRFEFGQDFAGLGGDTKYFRTQASIIGETRAFSGDVRLTSELTGGVLTMLDGQDSRIIDRYRGGEIRGFDRNGIGPRDLTATNEDALAGNNFFYFTIEADFPLGLPEEYGIRGGVFFDAGSVWALNNTQGTGGPVDDSFHLRTVIGASVFWSTPIGPLRFDFTGPIEYESYDETRFFDLTVSTRF
jgi:outer membrane protein insertion porin family